MRQLILRFVFDQSGATAIEYALIAAGISTMIILTVQTLGITLSGRFQEVSSGLQSQNQP